MKLKLNIVNKDAASLHEAYGISEKRSNEICEALNELSKDTVELNDGNVAIVMSERFAKIAELSNTLEEYTFAVVTHTAWLIGTGKW